MHKIKAIVFDMDGVLIDAKEWHYEALNKALGLFGYEISKHDHLATYDGLPTMVKLRMLSEEKGVPVGLHSFISEMKQIYTVERIFNDCKPVFAHEYALARLKKEGYLLAVASNSMRETVQLMMEKSNLIQYLNFYLSNQDVKKTKPDPEIYQLAVEKLRLQPDECLVVEDNQNGILAAQRAGVAVMQVKTTFDVNYENIRTHIAMYEKGEYGN